MTTARKGQGTRPDHFVTVQRTVKMREQQAAARWLPSQGVAKCIGVAGQKPKPILAGKVFFQRAGQRFGGREMDESIGQIDRRAKRPGLILKLLPFRAAKHFVDHHDPVFRALTVAGQGGARSILL